MPRRLVLPPIIGALLQCSKTVVRRTHDNVIAVPRPKQAEESQKSRRSPRPSCSRGSACRTCAN